MRTERFKGVLLSTLVIASLITPLLLLSPSLVHAALAPHDPIYIEGNENFTPANGIVSGSGTAEDPFIIEGWDISLSRFGIQIKNTTAYFIIRNCYVSGAPDTVGIHFEQVKNGEIDNNLMGFNFGIRLTDSNNNLISNNILNNFRPGIVLINSDNNLIFNNLLENISGGYSGISLSSGSNNNLIENNIVRKQSVGIELYGAHNNIVIHNLMENNFKYGIRLTDSNNNLISNNILGFNLRGGIILSNSDNNLISNNLVENHHLPPYSFGITLSSSVNNLVSNNHVRNNARGIYSDSYNNLIYHNNFWNNENQAYDNGINFWDNGYPSGGNYWSDYTSEDADGDGIGDTPYSISGNSNQDRYPLMNPFVPDAILPEEAPSTRWPLIAGIVGVIAIIIIVALYMRRRKPTEFQW